MAFLTSKPVLFFTGLIIGIALCIQIDLILGACSFTVFMMKLVPKIITVYESVTTAYKSPTSIGNHIEIDHNLCINAANKTVSCQLVAMNDLMKYTLPNWTDMINNEPNKLLQFFNSMNIEIKLAPFGTYYEHFDIEDISVLLIHSSPHLTKKKLFANGIIIHLHGGAFITGTHKSSPEFLSYLHLFTGLPVLSIAYKLAPQYPLQSGALLEDADKVVKKYLHDHLTVDYNKIYLIGDSAGGGAVLMWMNEYAQNNAFFGGVIAISPWTDLSIPQTASVIDNNGLDSMLNHDAMKIFQQYVFGCRDVNGELTDNDLNKCIQKGLKVLNEKNMNPMSADWSWGNNQTKILFLASEFEILKDDAVGAHEKALKNGIDSQLIIMEKSTTHVLPILVDTPEGLTYVAKISQVISQWRY